jgi:hypothetical protein
MSSDQWFDIIVLIIISLSTLGGRNDGRELNVDDRLRQLADAIEANENVMAGIDIMRRARAGTG